MTKTTRRFDRARRAAQWLWAHTSAGVALALIVAAFWMGASVGRRSAPTTPAGDAADPSAHGHEAAGVEAPRPQFYTCSMHPQVRLTDPDAKCPICHMDLIPVADAAASAAPTDAGRLALSDESAAIAGVETTPVRRAFPEAEVRLYGEVTEDQTAVARLTAYFPGRIDRLFVNYVGVPVKTGEHVAELYSPELLAAFEELRQAAAAARGLGEADLSLVGRATLDTLQAARDRLRLFGLTEAQIADAERGADTGDRLTVYAPIGGIVTSLAVREGDYVDTGEPLATIADLTRLWVDLRAFESQLPLLRWGQRVSFTVEAHPGETFTGLISFIEPMVDLRTRTAAVRIAVDNTAGRLKPGMFASAVARVRLSETGPVIGDELAGRWVCPMHPTVVEDAAGVCGLCGMDLVSAESLGAVGDPSSAAPALVAPRSAVLFTGTRSVVYVRHDGAAGPEYEAREVVLGPRAGDLQIVRAGLREGESVVSAGAFRIDSAMQIQAKPSMMSPEGGAPPPGHAHHGQTTGAAAPLAPNAAGARSGFAESLAPVFDAYFAMQEALAADDLHGFHVAADRLRTALAGVDGAGLDAESRDGWNDARVRFDGVSAAAIALVRRFGYAGDAPAGLAHCPMAFDNRGADWLQRGDTINNPYFGASMLRCGEIRETFAPRSIGGGERP